MVKNSSFSSTHAKSYKDAVQTQSMSTPVAAASLPLQDPPLSPDQIASLQEQFPDRVVLSQAKFAASSAFWRFAVIGKCLGHDVLPESLEKALTPQWSEVGEWDLFPMSYGFTVFRFASQADRDSILFGGPWVVDGAALALSPFDPEFRPAHCHITRAVLWVRLPDLPPAYWSDEIITDILSIIGSVVRLDDNTRNRTKGRYARAAVEIDLRQPLRPGVIVDVEGGGSSSFWQNFKYENLHAFCSCCRRVGHRSAACTSPSTSPSSSASTAAAPVEVASGDWSQRLLVRRRPGLQRRAAGLLVGDSTISQPSQRMPARGGHLKASHTSLGPTALTSAPILDDVTATSGVQLLPQTSLAGPHDVGPSGGLTKPFSSTSASMLKPAEPLGLVPSHKAMPKPLTLGKGDEGSPVVEMAADESHLIQEIMDDNSDQDVSFSAVDDVYFSKVHKKNKGKATMSSICLRPAPRDRAQMKKTKVTAAPSGKFSLLADLMNDVSAADIAAKYGPPP